MSAAVDLRGRLGKVWISAAREVGRLAHRAKVSRPRLLGLPIKGPLVQLYRSDAEFDTEVSFVNYLSFYLLDEDVSIAVTVTAYDRDGRRLGRGRLNGRPPERSAPESEHARMDRLNQIIRDVARRYDRVAVVDLAAFIAARDDDARLRPDGVHFTADTALELSGLLGPTLASLAPGADPAAAERPGLLPVSQRPKR